MEIIVEEHGIKQCKAQLTAIAKEVIKDNVHRLYVDQPKGHADKYPITVVGTISYNDRDSQIVFNASPMAGGDCEVSYVEAFTITESCLVAREQIFKKWKFIGKLSQDSFYLRHKKRLTKNATLTSVNNGTECLITRRHSGM